MSLKFSSGAGEQENLEARLYVSKELFNEQRAHVSRTRRSHSERVLPFFVC